MSFSVVTPISSVYAVLTVILGVLFLGETLNAIQIVAIFIALTGVALASTDIKNFTNIHSSKGVINAFLSLIGWGVYLFLVAMVKDNLGWAYTTVYTSLSITIFSGVAFIIFGKKTKTTKESIEDIFLVSFLYTLAWIFFNLGISQSLVSIVSVISSLSPLITVILAVLFYKEKLILNQKIGIFFILLSLAILST